MTTINEILLKIESTIQQLTNSNRTTKTAIADSVETLEAAAGMLRLVEGTLHDQLNDAKDAKAIAETGDEIGSWLLDPDAWQSTIDDIRKILGETEISII